MRIVYAFRNVDGDESAIVWYRLGDVLCAMGEWPGAYRWADLLETDQARIDVRFRDVDPNPDDPDLPHALSTEAGLWWLADRTTLDDTSRVRLAAIIGTAEVCRMVPVDGDRW